MRGTHAVYVPLARDSGSHLPTLPSAVASGSLRSAPTFPLSYPALRAPRVSVRALSSHTSNSTFIIKHRPSRTPSVPLYHPTFKIKHSALNIAAPSCLLTEPHPLSHPHLTLLLHPRKFPLGKSGFTITAAMLLLATGPLSHRRP